MSYKGISLYKTSLDLNDKFLEVIRLTLSQERFNKARSTMRLDGFIGDSVKDQWVCNEFSYNFVIFGIPSKTKPWDFSFHGHQLCLSKSLYQSQIIVHSGLLELNQMQSRQFGALVPAFYSERINLAWSWCICWRRPNSNKAQVHMLMGCWIRSDRRNLCGAYRDNRIVPYEGITQFCRWTKTSSA